MLGPGLLALPPQPVETDIRRDPRQPGRNPRLGRLVAGRVGPQAQQRLLRSLFGQRLAAQHPPRHRQHARQQTAHQRRIGVTVAACGPLHQRSLDVGRRAGRAGALLLVKQTTPRHAYAFLLPIAGPEPRGATISLRGRRKRLLGA